MKCIVVIPTYNEAENIKDLICRILAGADFDILVVDDNSPDKTADLVANFANDRVWLMRRTDKKGLGAAYVAGFNWALSKGYEIIGQMDADLSHDPEELITMSELTERADLILGSRYVKGGKIIGWGLWRHFCSRAAMATARRLLELKSKDVTTGFRLWRADLLRQVLSRNIKSNGYAFQEEMLFWAQELGAKIVEHPIVFRDRTAGKSKLGIKEVGEFFRVIWYLSR